MESNGTPHVRASGTVRSKGAARELPGRTIRAVIAKQAAHPGSPRYQLFIAFTDGTYLEIYSDSPIHTSSTLDHGGVAEIKSYMSTDYDVVMEAELLTAELTTQLPMQLPVHARPAEPRIGPFGIRNGRRKPGPAH